MAVIVGAKTGLKGGPITGPDATIFGAGITVPKDGPGANRYVPQNASDFVQLGITAPDSLWLCQEASGNLSDAIGSLTLTANGSPTYAEAVTGWTRTGLGFVQGTANQRFAATTGLGPNPSTTSSVWLCYAKITASPTGIRGILGIGADTGLRCPSADKLRVTCFSNNADGTATYFADGNVHPFLIKYNRAALTCRGYTDEENVICTYAGGTSDGQKGLGGVGGASTPNTMQVVWACMWSGTNAENLDPAATLTALGW